MLHVGQGGSILLLLEIGENGVSVSQIRLEAKGTRLWLTGGGAIDLLGSRFVSWSFVADRRAGVGARGSDGGRREQLFGLGIGKGFVNTSIVGLLRTGRWAATLLALVVLGNLLDLIIIILTTLDDFGPVLAIVALIQRGFTCGPLLTDFALKLLRCRVRKAFVVVLALGRQVILMVGAMSMKI